MASRSFNMDAGSFSANSELEAQESKSSNVNTNADNSSKAQHFKASNDSLKTVPPKPTVLVRSALNEVSAGVHNLLITARDKGVTSLKSIGASKHPPERVPIWKSRRQGDGLTWRKIAKKLHVEDLLPPEPIPHPAETPVLTKPSMLEALPTELQFKILHFAPNFATLSGLVRASPKFHQAYLAIREQVLQKITWVELVNRNVNPFSQRDFYEVRMPCNKKNWNTVEPNLKSLVSNCRASAQRTGQTELEDYVLYPLFSIKACILLLKILDFVGWTIEGRPGNRKGKPDRMDICGRSSYHVLNFSAETLESVALIRGTATIAEFWDKGE